MPNFVTTDHPIAQDNYQLVSRSSTTPRPDAAVVGFAPATVAEWVTGSTPQYANHALDQLASRVSANESALESGIADHGALTGLKDDDHPQYLRSDGTRDVQGNLQVSGFVNASGLRVSDVVGGVAGSVTLSNSVQPIQLGIGAKMGAIPGSGSGPPFSSPMAGWLRLYIDETIAAVPYWV
ncbi:MAG: hypothetical protein ACYTHJ_10135 [Planctomycetota bacterium]|jgi:hypothetical protein